MKTYFTRNTNTGTELLFEAKKIALYYHDIAWDIVFDKQTQQPSKKVFSPEFMKENGGTADKYKSAIEYFHRLSTEGGYVFAEYQQGYIGGKGAGCVLGKVLPGTQIERFEPGNVHVTLQLTDTQILPYSEYPMLLAARPIHATICHPRRESYQIVLDHLIHKKPIEIKVETIHYKMIEVMCEEYLRIVGTRTHGKMKYAFTKRGSVLPSVDISGRFENDRIFYAQVKNGWISSKAQYDLENFIADQAIGIIFAKGCSKISNPNVIFIDIEMVLTYFMEHSPTFINDIIGMKIA